MNSHNNLVNHEVRALFENLKLILRSPRQYIGNYFNGFRHEIDILFMQRILVETNAKTKAKLNRNWIEIIHRVDAFELKCLKHQATNQFNDFLAYKANEKLKLVELKLTSDNRELLKVIQEEIFKLERVIFLNRTIFFIDRIHFSNFDSFKRMNAETTVGKLIICKNEYFDKQSLRKLYRE